MKNSPKNYSTVSAMSFSSLTENATRHRQARWEWLLLQSRALGVLDRRFALGCAVTAAYFGFSVQRIFRSIAALQSRVSNFLVLPSSGMKATSPPLSGHCISTT